MHDPLTLAFTIKSPFRKTSKMFPNGYRNPLIEIWHEDPCRDGSDDSCGWFQRSRHGDKEVLERIVKRFEFDWDRTYSPSREDHDEEDGDFKPKTYFCGYFQPDGMPHLSPIGIVLNLFFLAALEVFKDDRKRADRFMRGHLFDIMLFTENPTDSLFDGLTRKFERGCGEAQTPQRRTDRIHSMASCIYAWILRAERPWWKHPKWHVHHWRIRIPVLQALRRFLFSRCQKCGGRFKWGETPVSHQWERPRPRAFEWLRGERDIEHQHHTSAQSPK